MILQRIPAFFRGLILGIALTWFWASPRANSQLEKIPWTVTTELKGGKAVKDCPVCPRCEERTTTKVDAFQQSTGRQQTDSTNEVTEISSLSPHFLAKGPRSPVTAAYFKSLVDSLKTYGPPAPSCFSNIDSPPKTKRKWDTVLIVAQGRSGSTSLVRLLNTLPCYNIRGENPNVFNYLVGKGTRWPKKQTGDTYMQAVEMIDEKQELWRTKWHDTEMKTKPSWWNRLDVPRTDSVVRLLVAETLEHVPGRITSGFKSINLFSPRGMSFNQSRWFIDDWVKLFPRTAIVFITRKGVENSAWWRTYQNSSDIMANQAKWFKRFADEMPSRYTPDDTNPDRKVDSVFVDYDDLIKCRAEGSTLEKMYEVLGEEWQLSRCKAIMGKNIEDWGIAMSELEFAGTQVGSL
jgi:hypothetical protein